MALIPYAAAPREINILLLGETGVGKSTTLNAIANYLKYSTIEEAQNAMKDFVEVIPSQFKLRSEGKEWIIKSGLTDDVNEKHRSGESVTQTPVGYTFDFGDYLLRIIDTPGSGDTGGSEADCRNLENILSFLQRHVTLHAIVFLVKNTDSRKNAYFKYCITELIRHLHKDVSRIMMFCFTHSRPYGFEAGEGFDVLKSFFDEELSEVNIELKPNENCFFIDNDAYRHLLAKRVGFPFKPNQDIASMDSWERSVEQVELMFDTIIQKKPHKLFKTVTLNVVRKIIVELAQPMVQMQKNIEANIASIQQRTLEIRQAIDSKGDLERFLKIEVWALELKRLPYPTTVCTKSKCIELITVDGEEVIDYKTRCHTNCACWFVTENMPGQQFLKLCHAMEGWLNITCKGCKCSWSEHMHINSEYVRVKRTVINPDVQAKVLNAKDLIKEIKLTIVRAEQLEVEYKQEIAIIQDITTKFAFILKDNSYFTHSKYFEDYMDFLIKEEQKKKNPKVGQLQKMKHDYQENQRILDEQIRRGQKVKVPIEQVPELKKQLLSLKHSGPSFEQILDTAQRLQEEQFCYYEKKVIDSSKKGKPFSKLYNFIFGKIFG